MIEYIKLGINDSVINVDKNLGSVSSSENSNNVIL